MSILKAYIRPEGFILAKETVLEFESMKELAYIPMPTLGVFRTREEVHAAIKELELPLGWVSVEFSQIFPGFIGGQMV